MLLTPYRTLLRNLVESVQARRYQGHQRSSDHPPSPST